MAWWAAQGLVQRRQVKSERKLRVAGVRYWSKNQQYSGSNDQKTDTIVIARPQPQLTRILEHGKREDASSIRHGLNEATPTSELDLERPIDSGSQDRLLNKLRWSVLVSPLPLNVQG